MYNSRGQLNDIVQLSVEAGKQDEEYFKEFIQNKYKIQLIPKSQFKPYDFSLNKIHKIEYKGLHYSLDIEKNLAISVKDNSKSITDVMIGLDKIIYYYYRRRKNKDLKFNIFYGFIESTDSVVKKISYRYIEITDLLYEMIMSYDKKYYYNKEHVLIPISSLKSLNECPFIQ